MELRWSDFSPLSSLDHSSFEIFLQYQKEAREELGQSEESRNRTSEDKTEKMVKVPISLSSRGVTVAGLAPGSVYSFTLGASHPAGFSWSLGQTQTAYTSESADTQQEQHKKLGCLLTTVTSLSYRAASSSEHHCGLYDSQSDECPLDAARCAARCWRDICCSL